MKVLIIEKKGWRILAVNEIGKYLNKGDIFLPDGTGFDYKVLYKTMAEKEGVYIIEVIVKKL